jgi:hypothetical protein
VDIAPERVRVEHRNMMVIDLLDMAGRPCFVRHLLRQTFAGYNSIEAACHGARMRSMDLTGRRLRDPGRSDNATSQG